MSTVETFAEEGSQEEIPAGMKLCAYGKCPTETFKPHRHSQIYCSKRCAQLEGWSSGSQSKRSDYIRKFSIQPDELAYRMNVLGQDCDTIAKLFNKSPATVFRKAKKFGLKPSVIRAVYRPAWIPRDRVCIILKVDEDKGADMEVIVKAILKEQRLDSRVALEIFPALPLAVSLTELARPVPST